MVIALSLNLKDIALDNLRREYMGKIMVVDDDIGIKKLLENAFLKVGYEVSAFTSGKDAINKFKNDPHDVLITDIIMPEKDGIETIIEIKKIEPNIKIIAISGGGRIKADDYLNIVKKLGVDYTFSKPFSIKEILEAVNNLLKK